MTNKATRHTRATIDVKIGCITFPGEHLQMVSTKEILMKKALNLNVREHTGMDHKWRCIL